MFKVAIDLGYGYVKGINENGKKILIRTAIGTGSNRQLANIFGGSDKTKEHIIISQNGTERQYYVGDLARKESRDCSSPFEKNKIDNQSTKVLLATAFAILNESNNDPVHLITGPPLLYAAEQKDSFKSSLTDYHAILQFIGEEKLLLVKFDRVTVFPQGAAVVYHMLRKQPELGKAGKTFVVIEPGYKTTEILMFEISKDARITPISGYSTTLELGMNLVEKALDESFFQKTGSKLIPSIIDRVMTGNSVITYNGSEINLQNARDGAKDELARNIIDGTMQVLGEQVGFVNKLIFAGGVMQDNYIANQITASLKADCIIVEDSQFANARGMLEVARMLELKEGQGVTTGRSITA